MTYSNHREKFATSCGVVLSFLVLFNPAARQARAQAPAAPDNFRTAKALFDKAEDFARAAKQPEACALYQASMELFPRAATASKIAECRVREGKFVAALEEYRAALQVGPAGFHDRAHQEGQIQQSITDIEKRVAENPNRGHRSEPLARHGRRHRAAGLFPGKPGHGGSGKALDHRGCARSRLRCQRHRGQGGRRKGGRPLSKEIPAPLPPILIPVKLPEPLKPSPPTLAPVAAEPDRGQRAAGAIIGGLGLLSLGVGAGFGICRTLVLRTKEMNGAVHRVPEDARQELIDQADHGRDISLACLGAGAAGAITGAIVYFTAPSAPKQVQGSLLRARIAPGYATLEVTW